MTKFEKLTKFERLINEGINAAGIQETLKMIGACSYDTQTFDELTIYTDLLPLSKEDPYTEEQRYLHFL